MKYSFLLSFLLCFFLGQAQNSKIEKKINKAENYIQAGNYDKAEKLMLKVVDKSPQYGKAWDVLTKTNLLQYQVLKNDPDQLTFRITTTSRDGEEIENDTLADAFAKIMNSINPTNLALNKAKHHMRLALAYSNDAYMASIYLRTYVVDETPDTAMADEAWKYFNKAEVEFGKRNFEEAAKLYQKALDIEPQFYKAALYLGDCYYHMEYFMQAADKFEDAIKKFPKELEPRKYLVDALMEEEVYDKALGEAIATMAVYPDLVMKAKLRNAARANGKRFSVDWVPRSVLPNKMALPPGVERYIAAEDTEPTGSWVDYVAAFEKIKGDCDEKGIIHQSKLTDAGYLEVYSWEQMLENSDDPQLSDARKMEKLGYLDCYALITCFHYDFYEQYLDFVAKNPEKVTAYYQMLMN